MKGYEVEADATIPVALFEALDATRALDAGDTVATDVLTAAHQHLEESPEPVVGKLVDARGDRSDVVMIAVPPGKGTLLEWHLRKWLGLESG